MKIFARYARFQSHCFSITNSASNVFTLFIAPNYVDCFCGKADVRDYEEAQHSKRQSRGIFFAFLLFVRVMFNEIWKLYWMTRQRIHLVISKRILGELKMLGAEPACHVCYGNKRFLMQLFGLSVTIRT